MRVNCIEYARFTLKGGEQDEANQKRGKTKEAIEMKVILYTNVSYQRLASYQQNMAHNSLD